MSSRLRRPAFSLLALAAALSAGNALAAPHAMGNLGQGLRELVDAQRGQPSLASADARQSLQQRFAGASNVQLDASGRVLVNVHLNGTAALPRLREAAAKLGMNVSAEVAHYRHGVFSGHLPVAQVEALARMPGVRSIGLALPPVTQAAKAVSQGAALVKSDQANAQGFKGTGITVGALSDSYDGALRALTKAPADVKSGDLPGVGNPNGNLAPVVVLRDVPARTDEGRAMLQIVHDLAPEAKLCFHTAFLGDVSFANGIRALADKAGKCGADVIVDDVIYLDEPMFSDGLIAQAVDEVAAQGVSYFSSAGNNPASQGYAAGFSAVANNTARGQSQTVDLSLIAASDSPGGFHNFAGTSGSDIAQTVVLAAADTRLVLQWNDPFDSDGVTTDYDVYVYSADGTQIVASSTDDNKATGRPVELVSVPKAGTYQIVIARADGSGTPTAAQLRYVSFGPLTTGEYLRFDAPTIYGHTAAEGSMSTAAVPWFEPYVAEPFTSTGPVTIQFDSTGQRLAHAVVRQKPDIAAPDGGNNTFFAADTDEDSDTLRNFFGTSAAAPHAAGVAALLMQKTGGPGTLSPAAMRQALQKSGGKHDLAPSSAVAQAKAGAATVTVTAVGDGSGPSGLNTGAFNVKLKGPAGITLTELTLDLSTANAKRVRLGTPAPGLQFDPRADLGFAFTLGTLANIAAADINAAPLNASAPFSQQLALHFAPGSFKPSSVVNFGVDRDEVATGGGGGSMDLLVGGKVRGTVVDSAGQAQAFEATFKTGENGKGWSPQEGYGLIDTLKALKQVP